MPGSACLKVVAVLEQAHVGAQAIVGGWQLGQQLWRQLVEVQRPGRKVEPGAPAAHTPQSFSGCPHVEAIS